ncbi:asparagine synthase-related protein [Actinomadura kijaniata]|uniref:asparagine synthase-related protein n=1 Tax=Actinomadura kijaniata TaxID=46161 RepID=UPI00083072F5|nr:asparagine synthase-related protein [Actinomadura kijaniata]
MRAYLAVVAVDRGRPVPRRVIEAAERAVHEAVPVPADVLTADRWTSEDGAVTLLAWANEPEHALLPRPLRREGGRVLGYCGYLADPDAGERALLAADRVGPVTETLGGCFSVFRAGPDGVEAATSIARVCPVYHAETGGARVIGTRALLVHLVARAIGTGAADPGVDLDVPALQPMVRHGFFTNDDTPFRGVRTLPAATVLTARPGEPTETREVPTPVAEPAPGGPRRARARVADLAEALVASAAPLARHGEPVTLALSGGRDSRLMAAVLKAAGVPMTAATHGFADDPDVVLATRIARRLGIEHRVSLPATDDARDEVVVEHPFLRAYDIIRRCEGMTSAYERVNGWTPYSLTPRTSGSGGETLRGGFLYDQGDRSPAGIARRVRTIFLSAERFCTPGANDRARAALRPWAERAERDGADVLDRLYLYYRSGRWIVGSHTATLTNGPYYHPFFDNRVVREALALPPGWRASEEVVFRLIETLAPELADIPPEGKRWRFEENRPCGLRDLLAWRRRAALVPRGRTSGFNWRKSYDDAFLKLLRDEVAAAPRELFDIVDEVRAKEHFAAVSGTWVLQTWHIYTLAVLLSGAWREPRPTLPKVRIPIPS